MAIHALERVPAGYPDMIAAGSKARPDRAALRVEGLTKTFGTPQGLSLIHI